MKISEMIQAKYPIEYYVNSENADPVAIRFADDVSAALAGSIERGLSRMLVDIADEGGNGISEIVIEAGTGGNSCCVSVSSGERYFIADKDPVDAVTWIVYAVSTRCDWLRQLDGCDISTRMFSSNQQYISAVLLRSANEQYESSVIPERINEIFKKLCTVPEEFAKTAPRFSEQPINDEIYKQWACGGFLHRKRTVQRTNVGELAEELYDRNSFMEKIQAFCKFIESTETFSRGLEKAADYLHGKLEDIPCLAIQNALVSLENLAANEYPAPDRSALERLMEDSIMSFSLTKSNLASAFRRLDEYYIKAARYQLTRDFFSSLLHSPLIESIREEREETLTKLNMLRRNLSGFCRVPDAELDPDAKHIGWSKLVNIQDSYLRCEDKLWTPGFANELRMTILNTRPCRVFICPQALYHDAESIYLREDVTVKPVPLTDNRNIFCIWADMHSEGGI